MKMKYILIAIITIGILAAGYVYVFVLNKEHPDFENLEADFKLSAEDLYTDFASNSEIASKKFNGKMLLLSGPVHDVELVDSLTIAVFIFNEGMFGNEGVRCTFLPSEITFTKPGELAGYQIKGFCSGFNDTDVILEKCSLTKE